MHCLELLDLEEKDVSQDLQPQSLTSYYKCHSKQQFIKKKKNPKPHHSLKHRLNTTA